MQSQRLLDDDYEKLDSKEVSEFKNSAKKSAGKRRNRSNEQLNKTRELSKGKSMKKSRFLYKPNYHE